jgi:hypothetical protein
MKKTNGTCGTMFLIMNNCTAICDVDVTIVKVEGAGGAI